MTIAESLAFELTAESALQGIAADEAAGALDPAEAAELPAMFTSIIAQSLRRSRPRAGARTRCERVHGAA